MNKKIATLFAALLLATSALAVSFDEAEARRMGGGRSFGSRPSYSQPAQRQQTPGMNQTKPAQQQNVGQTAPGRKGMFGGFGGLMGGLLAGSLLGALFMGMPFAGAGMFDLLLIGLVLFLVFRFIARRKAGESQATATAGAGAERSAQADPGQWSGSQWDRLRSAPSSHGQSGAAGATGQDTSRPGQNIPGFDEEEFLRGAKLVYTRLQASWDSRDLEDIREFATTEVYDEIARQAAEDPTPSKTEILLVNARVLEAKVVGGQTVATVYYDVLMREDQTKDSPEQVREVWHFRRDNTDPKASWKLEGIQQLEQ